jgi:hypothetical protein
MFHQPGQYDAFARDLVEIGKVLYQDGRLTCSWRSICGQGAAEPAFGQ